MSPISIQEFAPRNERRQRVLHLEAPGGEKFEIDVEFYPNRITQEPTVEHDRATDDDFGEGDDADAARQAWRNATWFCDMIASWDLTGELYNRKGEEIVAKDEPVPLKPEIVVLVPTWFTNAITEKLLDYVFPNRRGSRNSRRRS